MGTIQTLLKIKADASGAVSGLKPLQASLDSTATSAEKTDKALDGLNGQHNITVNDKEIAAARDEITRLRNQMREDLSVDINADTRDAQKRISQLQKTVKVLDAEKVSVPVEVAVDTTALGRLKGVLGDLHAELGDEGGGGTGIVGGLGAAARGFGAIGASGAAAGTGFGAAAVGAWKFGQMAADAETSITQLQALAGDEKLGEELFADLQKWAADTPFAIDDATEATKKLVAAGVPLEDIPDWLNDIGDVASATTGDLNGAATVFSQMVSKGKASYEELQQLAESGIPVWRVLAEKLGQPIEQVQKMATEGKLGADAIDLVRESLEQTYSGAMIKQADTFNGKMSTLKDTLGQTGQELGKVFLPEMESLVDTLSDVADGLAWLTDKLVIVTDKWHAFREEVKKSRDDDKTTGKDFLDVFTSNALETPKLLWGKAMKPWQDDAKESKKEVDKLKGSVDDLAGSVKDGIGASKEELDAFKKAVEAAEQAIKDTIEAFGNIGGEVRTKISFIINKDDLEEDIRKTVEGVKAVPALKDKKGKTIREEVEGIDPVELPADLKVGDIKGLDDKEQELIGTIDSWVTTGLEEGARRAEIVPGFDEDAWYRKVRKSTKGLLIEAGIDPKEAERVLTNVFGLPRKVPVGANISGAKDDLAALYEPVKVPIIPEIRMPGGKPITPAMEAALTPAVPSSTPQITPSIQPPTVAEGAQSLESLTAPKSTAITPSVADTQGAKDALDGLTHARRVMINPVVDGLGLAAVRAIFADLTKTETKTINVVTNRLPGGGAPGAPPQAGPQLAPLAGLLAVGTAMAAAPVSPYYAPRPGGAVGGTEPTGTTTRLAPRQTPVQVLLDGAVIADHLDARRSMAAVESIRRTA